MSYIYQLSDGSVQTCRFCSLISTRGKKKHRMRLPQGNDDKLGILRSVLNVVSDNGNIPEVQRGVNFVHEVQWRWLRRSLARVPVDC